MKDILILLLQIVQLIALAVYVIGYKRHMKISFVTTPKDAVIGLLAIGFIVCCIGIALNIGSFNWASIWIIAAAIVGGILLIVGTLILFDKIKINNDLLFNLITICLLIKWITTTIHHVSPMWRH